MIRTEVYYRRPKYTASVKGQKSVGRNGDGEYVTEAAIARDFSLPEVGYGVGETPAEARKSAYAHLARQLEDYMAGE